MITADDIRSTHKRIKPYIHCTPVVHSPYLSRMAAADVHFKLDCLQKTGSFKFRGAMSKLTSLPESERQGNAYAASTGNHGAAVSLGSSLVGMNGKVIVPEGTLKTKLEMIKLYGGDIEFSGTDCLESEARAQELVEENGGVYISPYNDEAVVQGQGSCGVEIHEQLGDIDALIVSVGGGGLIGGAIYHLEINVQDLAGNEGEPVIMENLYYDATSPELAVTAPSNDEIVNHATVSYSLLIFSNC